MLQVNSPTSPMFLALVMAVLVYATFAWQGLVRQQIPTMHTTLRGARAAGLLSGIAMIMALVTFQVVRTQALWGLGLLIASGFVFLAGLMLAERLRG